MEDVQTFRRTHPDSNIALRLAPWMIGIDVDAYLGKNGGATLAEAEERWGPLPPTLRSTSRDDGTSGIYLYRVPEGLTWPGEVGPGIELITPGHRYVTAPPSIHPNGVRYRFLDDDNRFVDHRGVHADDLPELPARWIRGMTEGKTVPARDRKPMAPAVEEWLKPLATGLMAPAVRAVMTDAMAALDGGRGSRHESARRDVLRLVELGQRGLPGVAQALKRLRRSFLDAVADDREPEEARAEWDRMFSGAVVLVTAAEAWTEETPTPLQVRAVPLPPFPVDALPDAISHMVKAVAEFTQTPPDLAGVVALGAISASVGGRAIVVPRGGWREPVNLYLLAVMESGTRKSPVFTTMTAPLLDAQRDLMEKTRDSITEAEVRRRIADRRAEQASAAAGKGDHDPDSQGQLEEAAVEAALAAEAILVPVRPQLLADNITPEAATSQLAAQDGRLAILSPEGGIFDILAGRYSKGIPDLDVFLKAYSGDAITVHRTSRPAEHVPHPALTMVFTAQPSVLRAIGRNDSFEGRGLLARYLYSIPPDCVGYRKVGNPSVAPHITDTYNIAITRLALTLAASAEPRVLGLTTTAAQLFLDYEENTEARLKPEGDLRGIQYWASKRVGTVLRLAGLLHVAGDPEGVSDVIGSRTVRAAIQLTDYFTTHAMVAFEAMTIDPGTHKAQLILDYLRRRHLSTFSLRDLHRALPHTPNGFPKAGDVQVSLDVLAEHGWIRRLPMAPSGRAGRPPSPRYDAHPSLVSAQSAEHP